ncbi:MAG: hypothetical protein RRZ24_02105 [Clostridia bacterium]
MRIFAITIVAGLAILFWWLSSLRVKKLHVHTDLFAKALCEAADHVMLQPSTTEKLQYTTDDHGDICVLPESDQPQGIRQLIARGVDEYIIDRMHTLYQMREEAQSLLTSVTLVGNKYNAVLNRCYDLTNLFFSFLDDPSRLTTQKELEDFHFFLQKQDYLRNVTLASIVSEACKQEISI